VLSIAAKNPKWAAIDKAIGRDGFKFVTLLRLSPLLPLAASNYLYGLTSVELGPYVLGSWLGMLPGTWAYVGAGVLLLFATPCAPRVLDTTARCLCLCHGTSRMHMVLDT
jgi:uncharacterized membrane protein YdjX (TVP38/TMEM64 family)